MFGFFKKQSTRHPAPTPPRIPPERAAAINRQFEEFAEGEIDPLEGALTMFQIDRDRYVPQVLEALGAATVELLLCENNPRSTPLMLRNASGYPMLAVFTQQRRATKCQQQFPESRFYLRLPFPVALKSLREGVGLVINPYEEVITWELAPDLVNIVKETILNSSHPQAGPPPLPKYVPGQVWAFKGSASEPNATLTILRTEHTDEKGSIVHIAVSGLNLPNGGANIGHMPFAEAAIDRSVTKRLRDSGPVPDFSAGYEQWREARGGVFAITVAEGIDAIRQTLVLDES